MNFEPKPDELDVDSPNYVDPEQAAEFLERHMDAYSGGGDYDDDPPSDYSAGWDAGYEYAQSNWLIWINRYRLMDSLVNWWNWRRAKLRWKMHDLRRWLKGEKRDNSDIPF